MTHLIFHEQCITCRFGCGATFERGRLAAHEDTCRRKRVACNKCQQQVSFGKLMTHKMRVCPEWTVQCSFDSCKMSMCRRELNAHVASCHKPCRFSSMGCGKQGSEEDIRHHERNQKAVVEHLKLVDEYIEMLKKREKAAKKLAERRQQASDGYDGWGEKLHCIRNALQQYRGIANSMLDMLQAMSNAEQGPAGEQERLCELHSGILSIADKLFAVEMELKLFEAELDNDLHVCLRALAARVRRPEIAGFDKGHMILKFNYHSLMAEIKRGAITVTDSQPFYTHCEGYKLLLRVYPTGYGPGAGTHMSAELVGLVGNNDQLLEWPFKPRKVIFRVRFGPDRPTIENIVEVGDGLNRPRAGQPPPTIGCLLFAPRESIEDPTLYDAEHDCFFVEVVVDTGGVSM